MKPLAQLILPVVCALLTNGARADDLKWLAQYNVVWDSPSKGPDESMPVGGGYIGANVWVENGDTFLHGQRGGIEDGDPTSGKKRHQDEIFLPRMGMTDAAADYNTRKLTDSPPRFPTFWGPGHDWVPDHNWGGSGMIGPQEMLLQTPGDEIRILPAWPRDWDVNYKLHAPGQTTVEVDFRDGKIQRLSVNPESRRADIVPPEFD